MKKILTSVLCVGMAAAMLASCSSKKFDPNSKLSKAPQNVQTTVPVQEFEIPEEEKDFTVDVDFYTNTLKITAYEGEAEELVIPTELTHPTSGKLPVTIIGDAAFLGNETLKSVVVPEGVTQIGQGSFQNCPALTKVTLPETLTTIGANAFYNSGLVEINIPATVTSIGYHAFSSQLNPTPWYASLTEDKVIVGDGILLKCNIKNAVEETATAVTQTPASVEEAPAEETVAEETEAPETEAEEALAEEAETAEETPAEAPAVETPEKPAEPVINYVEVDLTGVKYIAYDAFSNSGALALKVDEGLVSIDKNAVFVPSYSKSYVKFLLPYKSKTTKIVEAAMCSYEYIGVPEITENPFKWEFNSEADVVSWYGGNLDVSFDAAEGALYGKSTGSDIQFCLNDKINLPAADFKTLVITMKHNAGEVLDESAVNNNLQVYYNNGTGLGEAMSVKQAIETTSNGEYVVYTLDMTSDAWKDIISFFRIDTLQGYDAEFWIKSVEFLPVKEDYDYNVLLKPVTKAAPSVDNPHKYKFEDDENKALAWTMEGFEYSYAPITTDGDNDSIHGVLTSGTQASITSPELNLSGSEYRELIVRMRHSFTEEKSDANADKFAVKVYVDLGEGFSEEKCLTAEIEAATSGEGKIEYTFDMYTLDGWYGNVKAIKVVPCGALGGEFWIDKVEFVEENKLSKAEFISMLYEADGKKSVYEESIFLDVVPYDGYCNAVIWATEAGYVLRAENNLFNPDSKISGAEYAEIMNKYAADKGVEKVFDAPETVYEMDVQNAILEIVPTAVFE